MGNLNNELEALKNAINNIKGMDIYEKQYDDKRKTTKMYFLNLNGNSISPVLDYENMNHFILGFSAALKLNH